MAAPPHRHRQRWRWGRCCLRRWPGSSPPERNPALPSAGRHATIWLSRRPSTAPAAEKGLGVWLGLTALSRSCAVLVCTTPSNSSSGFTTALPSCSQQSPGSADLTDDAETAGRNGQAETVLGPKRSAKTAELYASSSGVRAGWGGGRTAAAFLRASATSASPSPRAWPNPHPDSVTERRVQPASESVGWMGWCRDVGRGGGGGGYLEACLAGLGRGLDQDEAGVERPQRRTAPAHQPSPPLSAVLVCRRRCQPEQVLGRAVRAHATVEPSSLSPRR